MRVWSKHNLRLDKLFFPRHAYIQGSPQILDQATELVKTALLAAGDLDLAVQLVPRLHHYQMKGPLGESL